MFHHGGAAEMQRRKTILAIFYVIPSILSPFKTYRRGGFAFFSEIYCVYPPDDLAQLFLRIRLFLRIATS